MKVVLNRVTKSLIWGAVFVLILCLIFLPSALGNHQGGINLGAIILTVFPLPAFLAGYIASSCCTKLKINDWGVVFVALNLIAFNVFLFDVFFEVQVFLLFSLFLFFIYSFYKKNHRVVCSVIMLLFLVWFGYLRWLDNLQNVSMSEKNASHEEVIEADEEVSGVVRDEDGKEEEVINPKGKDLISYYYDLLEEGKLDEAYVLKKVKKPNFATFESWYKNLEKTEVVDLVELSKDKYDFVVNLDYENGNKESYHVVMKVEENTLDTISSVKVGATGLRHVVEKSGNSSTLFLIKDGKKIMVELAKASEFQEFNKVSFALNNSYLIYFVSGYESNGGYVYSVEDEKVVHRIGVTSDLYGFTSSGKHFYNCSGSGMFGGDVQVFNVPSFSLKQDLVPAGALVYDCNGYDRNTNEFKYQLSFNGFDDPASYSYDFDSDTVTKF